MKNSRHKLSAYYLYSSQVVLFQWIYAYYCYYYYHYYQFVSIWFNGLVWPERFFMNSFIKLRNLLLYIYIIHILYIIHIIYIIIILYIYIYIYIYMYIYEQETSVCMYCTVTIKTKTQLLTFSHDCEWWLLYLAMTVNVNSQRLHFRYY